MTILAQLQGIQANAARLQVISDQDGERIRLRTAHNRAATHAYFLARENTKKFKYQADILNAMVGHKAINSVDVGRATGVGRTITCKRLQVLQAEGKVLRIGDGVKTKWRLA